MTGDTYAEAPRRTTSTSSRDAPRTATATRWSRCSPRSGRARSTSAAGCCPTPRRRGRLPGGADQHRHQDRLLGRPRPVHHLAARRGGQHRAHDVPPDEEPGDRQRRRCRLEKPDPRTTSVIAGTRLDLLEAMETHRARPPAVRRAAAAARRLRHVLRRDRRSRSAPRSAPSRRRSTTAASSPGRCCGAASETLRRGAAAARRAALAALRSGCVRRLAGAGRRRPPAGARRRPSAAPPTSRPTTRPRRRAERAASRTRVYPDVGDPGVDALHYDLDLAWDPDGRDARPATRRCVFRATARRPTTSSSTSARRSTVAHGDARRRGRRRSTTPGKDLVVHGAGRPRTSATTLQLALRRHPRAGRRRPPTRGDFSTTGWTITADGEVWTMQEPYGAYTWYAVNDQPSDKAFYDFTIARARADGRASPTASSSRAERRRRHAPSPAGTSTEPASSYLVTIAIGDYTRDPATRSAERRADHLLDAARPAAAWSQRLRDTPRRRSTGSRAARAATRSPRSGVLRRRLAAAAWRPRR